MADTFRCSLVTPTGEVFDLDARSAIVPAYDGQLGILARHAPLLVKLGYGPLTVTADDGTTRRYLVGGGFAQFKDDVLVVLTDEALEPSDISTEDARAQLDDALQMPGIGDVGYAKKEAAVERARALVAAAS